MVLQGLAGALCAPVVARLYDENQALAIALLSQLATWLHWRLLSFRLYEVLRCTQGLPNLDSALLVWSYRAFANLGPQTGNQDDYGLAQAKELEELAKFMPRMLRHLPPYAVLAFDGHVMEEYAMVLPRQLRQFLYAELRAFAAFTLLGTPVELRGRHPLFHASELARINLSIRIPSDYI